MTDLDAIRARADRDSIRELHAQDWECLLDLATQAFEDRNDLLAEVERLTRERDEARHEQVADWADINAALDELKRLQATVARVERMADEWERDHAKDDASSGGWFVATESAIEDLRAALRGDDS